MRGATPYLFILLGLWIFALGMSGHVGSALAAIVAPDEMSVAE